MTTSGDQQGTRTLMQENFYIQVAAAGEAIELGHPEVDVDHLLVGLLAVGGPSSRALLAAGVDLAAVRKAARAVHDDDLASLGVRVSPERVGASASDRLMPMALPINSRAEELLYSAPFGGDDSGLLLALLDDAGGRVRSVLANAGVEAEELRSRLDMDAAAVGGTDRGSSDDRSRSGRAPDDAESDVRGEAPAGATWMETSYSQLLPVKPEQVWALVGDPLRRPEWDPTCTAVRVDDEGRRHVTQRDESVTIAVVVRRREGRALAERETRAGQSEVSMVREIAVEERDGGTLVSLRASWPARGRAARGLSRRFLTRLIRMQLRAQAQGIAHAA